MLAVLALLVSAPQGEPAADLLVTNAIVYTANDRQPRAESVAVKDGRILFVGSTNSARSYVGAKTRVLDMQGATVLPGLTDSHLHLDGVGEREMTLNLEGIESLADFLKVVKKRVDQTPTGEWITGRGWIEKHWKPQAYPTRQDLDRVAPDHPVWLIRADGHSGVANSKALKLARITRDSPSPFGGEIMKDPKTGEPTGMLSDHAMRLIPATNPVRTEADRDRALLLGQEFCFKHGWTQVQVAGLGWESIERLKRLYRSGKLKLRTYVAARGPGGEASRLMRGEPTIGAFDQRLTVRTIKVVFDGALGSKGAALLEPYSDHNSSGFLTVKEDALRPMLTEALRQGIQVETHAIGDRANRRILDLYEEAFKSVPPAQRKVKQPRWRVEHAQIVHPDDIGRFAKLGVIPSMQPSHAIGDLHFAPSRLGDSRLSGAYAWQSFINAGSVIAGGSDAPVERGDPLIEFYAAVARKDLKGFSAANWHQEQAVSRASALKMFTLWPAFAAFEEKTRGSLEPGKLADMSIFSSDILRIPAGEIPKARCLMTIVGGEVVYDGRRKTAGSNGN
jgi:predicted amidohydrolase YtcJ